MISILTPVRAKDEAGALWLHEAIASVADQGYSDWEHIVVNDHSDADLSSIRAAWPDVRWLEAEGQGVSAARNQAAAAARGDLLLPLDADDKLAPSALARFAGAWTGSGVLYSDVMMFGRDFAKVYIAPAEYDFVRLLKSTFMIVGCLHRKADWERAGGWRLDLTGGLEDWEYWIKLGELGVCGTRVPEPLYWYRRHPTGRLAWLKANKPLWDAAYQTMRDIHKDSYAGRYPMGCCGGKKAASRAPVVPEAQVIKQQAARAAADGSLIQMLYVGPRMGGFSVIAGVTRTRYDIAGPGQLVTLHSTTTTGVRPEDVSWFKAVAGGRDFRVVEAPKPAPPVAPAEPVVNAQSEAWAPETMESVPLPEQEPKSAKRAKRG